MPRSRQTQTIPANRASPALSCNQTLSVNFGLTGEYGELSFNDFILRETVVSGAPAAGRVAKRSPISIPYIEI